MVIRDLLTETAKALKGIENYMFEAHLLVRSVLNKSPMDLVLAHKEEVDARLVDAVRSAVKRRQDGEPLQYILGTTEFMGIELLVEKEVLIPRADTETLVEAVLCHLAKKGASVLDICSGTGCVSLAIAYHNERVYSRGIDISEKALSLSVRNAQRLGLSERAVFEKRDIMNEHPSGRYDVIVSNPPYIRSAVIPTLMREVEEFEPHLALDGGEDGLMFYRRITQIAPKMLNENGFLAFEIGYDQSKEVSRLMSENFYEIKVIKDLSGNDRVVTGILKC